MDKIIIFKFFIVLINFIFLGFNLYYLISVYTCLNDFETCIQLDIKTEIKNLESSLNQQDLKVVAQDILTSVKEIQLKLKNF